MRTLTGHQNEDEARVDKANAIEGICNQIQEEKQNLKYEEMRVRVITKSRQLMNQSTATHITSKYKRIFTVEWGVDAKAFSNYYRDFYLCGCSA